SSGTLGLAQSPESLTVFPGESTSISCIANESISDSLTWYQQRPSQTPKILIYEA
ncbi:Hypothetical predicted protein, partial [Marmota monax]